MQQPVIEGIRDVMREYFPPATPRVNLVTHGTGSGKAQAQTPPGSRAQSPAPQGARSYAGRLTARVPGNRQSRPMDVLLFEKYYTTLFYHRQKNYIVVLLSESYRQVISSSFDVEL